MDASAGGEDEFNIAAHQPLGGILFEGFIDVTGTVDDANKVDAVRPGPIEQQIVPETFDGPEPHPSYLAVLKATCGPHTGHFGQLAAGIFSSLDEPFSSTRIVGANVPKLLEEIARCFGCL
jgi:hypothetical protein